MGRGGGISPASSSRVGGREVFPNWVRWAASHGAEEGGGGGGGGTGLDGDEETKDAAARGADAVRRVFLGGRVAWGGAGRKGPRADEKLEPFLDGEMGPFGGGESVLRRRADYLARLWEPEPQLLKDAILAIAESATPSVFNGASIVLAIPRDRFRADYAEADGPGPEDSPEEEEGHRPRVEHATPAACFATLAHARAVSLVNAHVTGHADAEARRSVVTALRVPSTGLRKYFLNPEP
ncbi:hypothetical protein T484DRAFT_1827849 [Baffinella frigidus]|nr:hypothetical protein T484DRAFT_1827849 [Cryptophyta sp. CCMP2293]